IRVAGLSFLPVGNDADSWAYRVDAAEGPPRFLKVRSGAGAMPGASVPAYLGRLGTPRVLAPLPTRAGQPYLVLDRFALALYPMLDARSGAEAGLSPAQWRELGAALAQVHAAPPTPELLRLVGRERFHPSRRELLPELEAALAAADPADPVAGRLAASWPAHRAVIDALVDQTDRLGADLARAPAPAVLCHADLHTWNVLVDEAGHLWIGDWDEAVLAPRERDLMFVLGGIGHGLVGPSATASFLEGYGKVTVDPTRLTYYRCAWAVQDIAAYGEQVLLSPTAGEATRRAAVEGFEDLFAPGNIADLARS
ncbi:MAG TPA: phosphotransferase, partial [Actinomycetes bacterium]|nr:phosphotransferase [Actinomycetes bacterium]